MDKFIHRSEGQKHLLESWSCWLAECTERKPRWESVPSSFEFWGLSLDTTAFCYLGAAECQTDQEILQPISAAWHSPNALCAYQSGIQIWIIFIFFLRNPWGCTQPKSWAHSTKLKVSNVQRFVAHPFGEMWLWIPKWWAAVQVLKTEKM